MMYKDNIHGEFELQEKILRDLIESKAMQRLKGVLQHGISGLIGITAPISRFDHSLGVMLLVRRLGAGLDEQIAAMLHDVSHTAFSHVIDYVFDGHDSQSYHDEMKASYLIGTDVPEILASYGRDWHDYLYEERFPLLEQPSPRLCADRLDYFLRDSVPLGLATEVEVVQAGAHLVVADGRIAVDDVAAARWLGDTFMACDDASWANFREVGLYELTAQAIKRGLVVGAITEDDFWLTDKPVWKKLHAHSDGELQAWLQLVDPETRFVWDEANPTFSVSTKLRAIDPDVVVDGRILPLSTMDDDFGQRRENYLSRKAGKWPMRVVG